MKWFYAEAGQQRGPVSEAEFQTLVANGTVSETTLVWHEGMSNWLPYGQVKSPVQPPLPTMPPLSGAPNPQPAAAQGWGTQSSEAGKRNAMDRLNGPSIGLMVTAAFGFMIAMGSLGQGIMGFGRFTMPPDMPPEVARMFESMGGALGILNALFIAILSAVILVGALKMRKLESYGLCMAAAIIALVPCFSPCCCIGLPVGIWALVVMSSPDVKPYFE